MPSEYDSPFDAPAPGSERSAAELAAVRRQFADAARPFLSSSLTWLTWALLLPAVALATPWAAARDGARGVLLAWSLAILAGGLVEASAVARGGGFGAARSPLAAWALAVQGNLSLVGVGLSFALLMGGRPELLPALWLLLIGHSLFVLGGLAGGGLRAAGILYQLGGVAALLPGVPPLGAFAAATFAGNLWLAWSVRRRRTDAQPR